jgi:hypothetical protein
MIFYPLVWKGIPLHVVEHEPFGLIGWQGIVPAKAAVMSARMTDMVTSQLVDVEQVTCHTITILIMIARLRQTVFH